MKVQFRNANPSRGNESVLLRFEADHAAHTPCVLVDAGEGVDLDAILDDDEYLAAVLLTHAHLDHYRSLDSVLRDGAPVYAGPDTAAILDDVLGEGRDRYDLGDTDAVLDAITPVDDWETVVEGLRIAPVPAGHAPGAVGFYVAFDDGPETHTILATGDFTTWRAGGYPGLDPDDHGAVETVVLCGATDDDFEANLTDVVGTAVRRAQNGSTVLVTASGLTGIHLAYVLGNLVDRYDARTPITIAGHAARLYESLDYDVPGVSAVPEFSDPEALLDPGRITIAGPEVPVEGSSANLFEVVRDDPAATLVQATGGGSNPVESADCTVLDYLLRNHPPEAVVDGVIDTINPLQVVVTHQRGDGLDRYKDKYTSFVWATDDHRHHTLYDGSHTHPPWMTDTGVRRVKSAHYGSNDGSLGGAPGIPSIDRADDPDLAREGLAFDVLVDRYHLNHDPGSARTDPARGKTDDSPALTNGGADAGDPDSTVTEVDPAAGAPGDADGTPTDRGPSGTDTGETDPDQLAAVLDRLDRIEAALEDDGVRARVVDAGDGVRLLRLLDDSLDHLDHGEEVRISVDRRGGRADTDATGSETEDPPAGDGDSDDESGGDAPAGEDPPTVEDEPTQD